MLPSLARASGLAAPAFHLGRRAATGLQIFPIELGALTIGSSGLVLFRRPGTRVTIPSLGFLILGGEAPILVDAEPREAELFETFRMAARKPQEMTSE